VRASESGARRGNDSVFERGFDQLETGERFETTGRTITESDLVSFAALTGDRHPLHTDASWAAASPFGKRVAHGMLVLSYALGLVPFDPAHVVALRGVDEVVFKRPTYIGDTIRVEGRVESLEPLAGDVGLVTCRWKVLNERDETLVRAKLRVLWRRAGAALSQQEPDRSGREAEDAIGSDVQQAIGNEVYL
jgi:3-hydroxybutyryl-CoA dehydratase